MVKFPKVSTVVNINFMALNDMDKYCYPLPNIKNLESVDRNLIILSRTYAI
uniref:Uncharacterized protein n=1 Tax=Arundo donax TaxID=35708 RepID=A0A0A8YRR6_ARUDO